MSCYTALVASDSSARCPTCRGTLPHNLLPRATTTPVRHMPSYQMRPSQYDWLSSCRKEPAPELDSPISVPLNDAAPAATTEPIVSVRIDTMLSDRGSSTMVTLAVEESSTQMTSERTPIDLVCVIDVSGSMDGSKILSVQETLHHIVRASFERDFLTLPLLTSFPHRFSRPTTGSRSWCSTTTHTS